jgi:hypothetical protein
VKNRTLFWLLILGLMAGAGVYVYETRGFRNNNPGNLRYGVRWLGVIGQDADGYAIFDTLENGIRAMGVDLLTKIARGLNTPAAIIQVYAPPSDNNPTDTYITKVAEWSGLDPNQTLTRADMPTLAEAMIRFENGHKAPTYDFTNGMNLALAA